MVVSYRYYTVHQNVFYVRMCHNITIKY